MSVKTQVKEAVIIRFSGDSGDGIQLMGNQFSTTAAFYGNDMISFADFPAEIRAPKGTLAGVSGFQLHFGSREIFEIGDTYDALIAMNPAALKKELQTLKKGGVLIVDRDSFSEKNLKLAGYDPSEPLLSKLESLGYRVYSIKVTQLTQLELKGLKLKMKEINRCRNMFVLGFVYWIYGRSIENTKAFLEQRFEKNESILQANLKVLSKGYYYGETIEAFIHKYRVPSAKLPKGTYRNVRGNEAISMALVTAAQKSSKRVFFATYPITPASDILHELVKHRKFGVRTFQAEDEIAAMGAAIGASYAGDIAVTATSGPGMSLKTEAIGLAIMLELPLVIINVQRGGPSTGLPTKTEQADLFQALFSRNGEAPVPVLAARSPGHCFEITLEAVRMAIKYMTPVILLSDAYIANGITPWKVPEVSEIPAIQTDFGSVSKDENASEKYLPYQRNEHLGRPWIVPGTPGKQHRIGGLEKDFHSGDVSYDPENHEHMVKIRAKKIDSIDIPQVHFELGTVHSEVLLLGWGSTFGVIKAAALELQKNIDVAQIHLDYIHPLPENLFSLIEQFDWILLPEMNLGQLAFVLRGKTSAPLRSFSKVKGQPFKRGEIVEKVLEMGVPLKNQHTPPK